MRKDKGVLKVQMLKENESGANTKGAVFQQRIEVRIEVREINPKTSSEIVGWIPGLRTDTYKEKGRCLLPRVWRKTEPNFLQFPQSLLRYVLLVQTRSFHLRLSRPGSPDTGQHSNSFQKQAWLICMKLNSGRMAIMLLRRLCERWLF